MKRRRDLDLLRGLMLVMMLLTHLPTRFSEKFSQPFGYVSAAEGFIVLSAFMAGLIHTALADRSGIAAMRRAFFKRVMTVYICHALLLAFLFFVIARLGVALGQPGVINLLGFYLSDPWAALPASVLLIYSPPLLDILPLYVLMLLSSPMVLTAGLRRGWRPIFICSGALWLCAQFSVSVLLYDMLVAATGLRVPYSDTGAFETLAWQLLWVFGLWLGCSTARGSLTQPFPPALLLAAASIVVICLLWRHLVGQVPIAGDGVFLLNRLFDKWRLGPLRLVNFFAMLVLIMHYGERLAARLPRIGYLEKLGAASLPVFCVHLAMVLLALAVTGEYLPDRSLVVDALLLTIGLCVLYATALISLRLGRKAPIKS